MNEMLKAYIGTRCMVYTLDTNFEVVDGIIKNIDDQWIYVEIKGSEVPEAVRIDYITKIKPYPEKNKK